MILIFESVKCKNSKTTDASSGFVAFEMERIY